ncbi:Uncharacterised protein [Fusicatenibacter sp. 2789STDY5834925]|nr:Uncharacterised protein [Fusicatenibacter sp. 2789STDY5834925]
MASRPYGLGNLRRLAPVFFCEKAGKNRLVFLQQNAVHAL